MKDKKDLDLNNNKDDETIKGVINSKELSDEAIKIVTGGVEEYNQDNLLPCRGD